MSDKEAGKLNGPVLRMEAIGGALQAVVQDDRSEGSFVLLSILPPPRQSSLPLYIS